MMENVKTYSADVPLYITNPIFQLVAVLLIIANCTNNKNNTASIWPCNALYVGTWQ